MWNLSHDKDSYLFSQKCFHFSSARVSAFCLRVRWEGGSGSCVKRMQITALGVNSSKPAVQRNANSDDYNTEQVSTRDPRSWHLTFKQNLFQRGVSEKKRGFRSCKIVRLAVFSKKSSLILWWFEHALKKWALFKGTLHQKNLSFKSHILDSNEVWYSWFW